VLLLFSDELTLFFYIHGTDCGSINCEDLCEAAVSGELETPIALRDD
jgi:hypothetical protein